MQKWGENISNRHLGMRFYIGIVMIMVSEYKLCKSKIWLLRARCSRTETFISTPGPLLMGRLTTRLITY